jgi:phosphoglycolate phosphatase-like HAD superfamily hydrolase
MYVLWDIDGTLIRNNQTGGGLYVAAVASVLGKTPTRPEITPHGMTEGQLLTAILEANGSDMTALPAVLDRLDELSREQHEAGLLREACPGVEAAIAAVAQRGWVNALLTGNGPTRSRYKLFAAGIDVDAFDWEHSFFGHESPTRHHLTAGVRPSIGENSSVIIGDTPNDGEAADSAGIPFIAVATGIYRADELRATSALVVVDDLESGLDAVVATIAEVDAAAAAAATLKP